MTTMFKNSFLMTPAGYGGGGGLSTGFGLTTTASYALPAVVNRSLSTASASPSVTGAGGSGGIGGPPSVVNLSYSNNSGSPSNALNKFASRWGYIAGRTLTVAQIAMHTIMIVEQLRKNVAIKSQNINMTEFGHETGQRFDQYN